MSDTTYVPRFPGDTRRIKIEDWYRYKGGVNLELLSKEEMRSDIIWLLEKLDTWVS
jgi:hypothetical protein